MYVNEKPVYGSQIKVNRGLYSHHGIYIDDDHVIHFASLIPGHETDPESASIVETTLDEFLKGGILEVRKYTKEEMKNLRPAKEIVEYAKSKLGTKGYNIVTNNCEHFSNECAFGKRTSEQVNKVIDLLSSIFTYGGNK